MGPPGSGKGTVSEKIIKEFNVEHVSPGVMLREEVRKGTEFGQEIKEIMQSGELVSEELVIKMTKEVISGKDNYILDGYPRTIKQAEEIKEEPIDIVIDLTAPEEVLIARFAGRRMCTKCGEGYHIKFIPPKEEDVCDKCGGELIRRKDDEPESVKKRLQVYQEKTQPLINYYKKKGLLKEINGALDPEEVFSEVKKLLGKLNT